MKAAKLICVLGLFFIIYGCSRNELSGKYRSYWYETYHELILRDNSTFEYKSEGHLGGDDFSGTFDKIGDTLILNSRENQSGLSKFLVLEDGCLAELETRFGYCQYSGDDFITKKRKINYPQIKERNRKEKDDVIQMLEIALTNPEIRKYIEDTTMNLIVQEYYEINKRNNLKISCFEKEIELLSKEEIKLRDIKEYLIIDEINIGVYSVLIDFQVMPEFSVGILDAFYKENDEWQLNKRWEMF